MSGGCLQWVQVGVFNSQGGYGSRKWVQVADYHRKLAQYSLLTLCFALSDEPVEYVRSFACVDCDMDFDSVEEGKCKLLESDASVSTFTSTTKSTKQQMKSRFQEWLRMNEALPLNELCKGSEPFRAVWHATRAIGLMLQNKGIQPLVFFTGGKGFRVLWHDPALYFRVRSGQRSGEDFIQCIAPEYFKHCPESLPFLDPNVYDPKKGIKPDVRMHPDSGLWPSLIALDQSSQSKIVRGAEDETLTALICDYHRTLALRVTDQCDWLPCSSSSHSSHSSGAKHRNGHQQSRALVSSQPPSELLQRAVAVVKRHLSGIGVDSQPIQLHQYGTRDYSIWFELSGTTYCIIDQRSHSLVKSYWVLDTRSGALSQRCFSAGSGERCELPERVIIDPDQCLEGFIESGAQSGQAWLNSLAPGAESSDPAEATLEDCDYAMPLPHDLPCTFVDSQYLMSRQAEAAPDTGVLEDEPFASMRHRTVSIRSPMASGKTELLVSYLKWLRTQPNLKNIRVACLTSRKSFAYSVCQRLNCEGLEVTLYNFSDQIHDAPRVVVQLDSLPKLVAPREHLPASFDVVVLDEIESLLQHMSSKVMRRKGTVFSLFQYLVRHAGQVIALDADFGQRGFDWTSTTRVHAPQPAAAKPVLNAVLMRPGQSCSIADVHRDRQILRDSMTLRPPAVSSEQREQRSALLRLLVDDEKWIINRYLTDRKTYVFCDTKPTWFAALVASVRSGKKCVVPCNSKRIADMVQRVLAEQCSSCRTKLYTSKSDDADLQSLGNCNEIWTQFDVVIYTPTIGIGVDFKPLAPHFHLVFAYAVTSSNSVRDFVQMMARAREIIDQRVYLYVDCSTPACKAVSRVEILESMCRQWHAYENNARNNQAQQSPESEPIAATTPTMNSNGELSMGHPDYLHLVVWNRSEAETSKHRFVPLLRCALAQRGASFAALRMLDTKLQEQTLRSLDTCQQDMAADHAQQFANALCLPSDLADIRQRCESGTASIQDKLMQQRVIAEQRLGLALIHTQTSAQQEVVAALYECHANEQVLDQFLLYYATNQSLASIQDTASNQVRQQDNAHANFSVNAVQQHNKVRLLKGMAQIIGFATVGVDPEQQTGEFCSHAQYSTVTVQQRLNDQADWLKTNVKDINLEFGEKIEASPSADHFIRAFHRIVYRHMGLQHAKSPIRTRTVVEGKTKRHETYCLQGPLNESALHLALCRSASELEQSSWNVALTASSYPQFASVWRELTAIVSLPASGATDKPSTTTWRTVLASRQSKLALSNAKPRKAKTSGCKRKHSSQLGPAVSEQQV